LLVAGSTGSGKSVAISSLIVSLVLRNSPRDLRLVLVDPKKVELQLYNDLPHLLSPVITDPELAATALENLVKIMEQRYELFASKKVRNIESYNKAALNDYERMPFIVIIIDELADLMLLNKKNIESSIMRITQMARAAGMHLVVATQRPSVDVITGVIKSNIPSRIAFSVASQIDSRTILDESGAEKLLGKGDMFVKLIGENSLRRIQGCFLSDDEIIKVVKDCSTQAKPQFIDLLYKEEEEEL
jgi:S-DNA-T family DNA segregation ATPase FtsK/SpoIIIE